MPGLRSLFLFASAAVSVIAQTTTPTQDQLRDCLQTIEVVDFEPEVTYSTTDDTHYRNQTWRFDPVTCNFTVDVTRMFTQDDTSGTRYTCAGPSTLGNTGFIHAQCSTTLGFIARLAEDGNDSWLMGITAGQKPAIRTVQDYYTVTPYTEPEPSGGAAQRRRRARALQQLPFKCEQGFSYCPTGPETFGCTDTSSNLISCGACPSDPNSKDCSNIDGANHVECRGGDCYVNSCLRGYQVSADRKSCRPFARRR